MLQYSLLITRPKASDYLYNINKGEIDMNSNLITESKVTECNRMSLTIFTQKSMSQALQEEYGQDYVRRLVHALEIPEMCPGWRKTLFKSNDCDFLISSCDIDFCAILLHSVTFDSVTKLLCMSISSLL